MVSMIIYDKDELWIVTTTTTTTTTTMTMAMDGQWMSSTGGAQND